MNSPESNRERNAHKSQGEQVGQSSKDIGFGGTELSPTIWLYSLSIPMRGWLYFLLSRAASFWVIFAWLGVLFSRDKPPTKNIIAQIQTGINLHEVDFRTGAMTNGASLNRASSHRPEFVNLILYGCMVCMQHVHVQCTCSALWMGHNSIRRFDQLSVFSCSKQTSNAFMVAI